MGLFLLNFCLIFLNDARKNLSQLFWRIPRKKNWLAHEWSSEIWICNVLHHSLYQKRKDFLNFALKSETSFLRNYNFIIPLVWTCQNYRFIIKKKNDRLIVGIFSLLQLNLVTITIFKKFIKNLLLNKIKSQIITRYILNVIFINIRDNIKISLLVLKKMYLQ